MTGKALITGLVIKAETVLIPLLSKFTVNSFTLDFQISYGIYIWTAILCPAHFYLYT